jgi:hypothetical protein
MSNVALTRTNLLLETAKVRRLRKALGSPSNSEAVRRAINERLEVEPAGTKGGLMAKATLAKSRGPRAGRRGKPRATGKRGAIGTNGKRAATSFSQRRSIEELAAEQGVRLDGQLERILGAGADLWASDEAFEEFVQGIYERRRESRGLGER